MKIAQASKHSLPKKCVIPLLCLIALILVILTACSPKSGQESEQNAQDPVTCGWGDDAGGRASYTTSQVATSEELNAAPVFNSISDGVIGDEKNFVGAREDTGINAGKDNIWNANEIEVEDGKQYLVRIYLHNDSPATSGQDATGTRAVFIIPPEYGREIPVHGIITTDNASPSTYWDGVKFVSSEHDFCLRYVYGSAFLEGTPLGPIQLGDEIATKLSGESDERGILLGYDALDGIIPADAEAYLSIKVAVSFETSWSTQATVRQAGTTEWLAGIDVKSGDLIEIQYDYQNQDTELKHRNVTTSIGLPDGIEYVPGSTILYNSAYPEGVEAGNDAIVTNGLVIGDYMPGANAYIRITARITATPTQDKVIDTLCYAQVWVGAGMIKSTCTVRINPT